MTRRMIMGGLQVGISATSAFILGHQLNFVPLFNCSAPLVDARQVNIN
jgi:hypothetical protein